jgi:hypothetical protein
VDKEASKHGLSDTPAGQAIIKDEESNRIGELAHE